MSRIREFEPRQPDDDERERETPARKTQQLWPGSAWFAVGTMIVLNLLLGAFIVKTELDRRGPGDAAASAKADVPRIEPRPEVAEPDASTADATKAGVPNPGVRDLELKPSSTRSNATRTPKFRNAKRAAITARRPTVTPKHFISEPMPQARFTAPQMPPSRTPAPLPAAVAAPVAPPGSGAIVTQPALVASIRTPAVGVRSQAEPSQKVTAPTAAGIAAKKAQPALDPKAGQNQKQPIRVASVGLPGMDKGLVVPKTAVGPLSPKLEIVRRPPEPKVDVPNCGGDVQIPCPTLKKRPAGGSPDGDRW